MFVLQKGFLSLEKLFLCLSYNVGANSKFHADNNADNKEKSYRQDCRL